MEKKKRKAFSLVELVVVLLIIAILATSVFTGGISALGKSRTSRVKSDLHNFEVWIQTSLTEHGFVANIQNNKMSGQNSMKTIVDILDEYLPTEYKMVNAAVPLTSTTVGNIRIIADTPDTGKYVIFESKKHDAWDNPYFVIFDCTDREYGSAEFYITVASAGPNGQATIGGNIDTDDIFCIGQSHNNGVSITTYDCSEIESFSTGTQTLRFAGDGADENSAVKYVSYKGTTATAKTKKKTKKKATTETGDNTTPVVKNHEENHGGVGSWTSVTSIDGMSADGTYVLAADITDTRDWVVDKTITVCLNGHSINLGSSAIVVAGGGNLSFENCSGVANISRVVVMSGSCVIAEDANVHISGNTANTTTYTPEQNGGGVYVANGGSFTMFAGVISGNTATGKGGGVYVANGGSFSMVNGAINANQANSGNGSAIASDGGTISIGRNATIQAPTGSSAIYTTGTVSIEDGATIAGDVVQNATP